MNTAKSKGSVISIEGFSNGTTETIIQAGEFRFVIDEPESFGGCNKAPSPVAYLLGAVSGCVVAIGMQVAKELGMTITKLNTKVDGSINSEAFFGISQDERAGFSEIRIVVDVESDAAPEQLSRWTSEVKKRCPVIDNLVYTTRVTIHQHLR